MSSEKSSSTLGQAGPGLAAKPAGQKRSNFRWSLAIFAMLMTFMSYIDRINLAVTTPAIIKELHFTKVQIGTFQTVFFLCYALFQIPSGTLTEFFGHRRIVPLALTWWSIFTSLTAVCRGFSTWIVVRALFGIGEAPIYPGLNAAFSYWFPRRERGRAVGMMVMGAKFGPAVGIPAATLIMLRWGWRSVFVIFGVIGVLIAIAYYLLLRTHPSESRFVNEAELEYIADGQAEIPSATKIMPPWKDLLRSSQVWAVGAQFATADYIQYVFIAWLPVYLLEAHHFSLKQMGFAAALPELGFAFGTIACGIASDYLIGRGLAGARSRAWFAGSGLFFCGVGLALTALATDKWTTVLGLTLSLMSLGLTMNSAWTTCTDLAGKFSGTVSGWMNFWGNIVGGIAPMFTAWIATHYGWQTAIFATASTGLIGAVCWLFVKPHKPLQYHSLAAKQAAASQA
jgi:ACS family glucarate transporter-like MFS transporter